ncbi:porin [Gymnodinialimonas ceratoperidinii]|uniref:Porin n=1 Tax=Gymnodinialimonas ceratoperidinii TaxID=2856823 RepID=A0A8F6Y9W4_9RHOB|nr:porin [Gymnodinialimonas ceratoperidinii]QXT39354.1 porin [Gymnodinialimonas ceratoperidinii]
MIRPAIFVGVLAALPSTTVAQGISFEGAATIGYNFNTISGLPGDDLTLNGASIDVDGDLRFSEHVSVGLGFGLASGELDTGGGTNLDVDLMSLAIEPVYNFGNGGYVGAYYRTGDLDIALLGPLSIGIDTNQYGIFGGYDFGQGHVEAFYGVSDLDNDSPGFDVDIVDYGLSASYDVMPALEVYGAVMRTEIGAGGSDFDVTGFSIGADYMVNDEFTLYGAVGRTTFVLGAPDDIHATGLTLGASYDLTAAASMPLLVSAEYSHTVVDGSGLFGFEPQVDRFALGLTIPIGNNASAVPLNSNTRAARGEYRSAIASVIQSF